MTPLGINKSPMAYKIDSPKKKNKNAEENFDLREKCPNNANCCLYAVLG